MARAIVMPSMGMYTEEGVLTAWLRPGGTRVTVGEPIAEITTEKATFEIPAPQEGTLYPVATVGTTLRVESLIGYILKDREAPPQNVNLSNVGLPGEAPQQTASSSSGARTEPLRASPVAKRIAAQHGIDLRQVKGSGPSGRIIEADLDVLIRDRGDAPIATVQAASHAKVAERLPMRGLRRSLAEGLRRTLSNAASTTLTREACADVLVAARKRLTELIGSAIPFDALFVRIFAAALGEQPELNAVIDNETIVRLAEINIGFAVTGPAGLVVPVVRDAGVSSFSVIVRNVRDLAERVRSGRLQPQDVADGTATISNLGNYHVDAFTPILNGAQSSILGVGRIAQRPIVRDGELVIAHTCVLSLTFDHRVADGAPAALLLDAVVRRMNDQNFLAALSND